MKHARLLLLAVVLLYASVFTFVEVQPSLFGVHPAQVSALVILLGSFMLLWSYTTDLKRQQRARLLMFFAGLGVIISSLMTYAHFNSASEFCPPTVQGVPCDIVNQSIYSEIAGIPVAILGILAYALIFYLSYNQTKKKCFDPMYLHLIALGGVAFTIWLNYIQFVVLMTLCLYCEFSAATILVLALLSYQSWRDE